MVDLTGEPTLGETPELKTVSEKAKFFDAKRAAADAANAQGTADNANLKASNNTTLLQFNQISI